MKVLFAAALLFFVPVAPRTQETSGDSNSIVSILSRLKQQADEAHAAGHIGEEIDYRQQLSREAWGTFSHDPDSLNEYKRYNIIDYNDFPLGLLLEGTHRFSEAEEIFRHNRAEYAAERIAGNDTKSVNELQLADLLAREGNDLEAERICSYWKNKMSGMVPKQNIYSFPVAPIYDTAEVETARWDFACGRPDEGLKLVARQIAAHPHMLASFIVLRNFYDANGNFEKARKAELDGSFAVTGR